MATRRSQSALRYPLNTILGSEARVSVLRELFHHGGKLSSSQLVARTRLAQSSVREALIVLVEARIVVMLGANKSLLYEADRKHPIWSRIDSLFAGEEARYNAIVGGIVEIAKAQSEIIAVWLYGSVARGDDGFASDVDLALVVEDARNGAVLERFRDALTALEYGLNFQASVIGLTPHDLLRLERAETPLLQNMLGEAIALQGKRPDELLRQLKRAA